MLKYSIVIFFFISSACSKYSNDNAKFVFLLAGQSNMSGRANIELCDTIISDRILTIDENLKLIEAISPIHFYESNSGLSCGISFANTLIAHVDSNVEIVIIPTAIGGSTISNWINDDNHRNVESLTNFIEKLNLGLEIGDVKGVLWHLGESDSNDTININNYKSRMSYLFSQFRSFSGDYSLPIFVGQLGSYSNNNLRWQQINNQIIDYSITDENCFVIYTSDLNHNGDFLHFDSESQRKLGCRFAISYVDNFIK